MLAKTHDIAMTAIGKEVVIDGEGTSSQQKRKPKGLLSVFCQSAIVVAR
jgi:hypothetical protein